MKTLKTKWTEQKRISKERLEICATCEHYDAMYCKKCGCHLLVKTYFPSSSCPLNKWKAYQEE